MSLLIATASAAGAPGTTHLAVSPRSTLLLTRSSNVAAWRCTGTTLKGVVTVASPIDKINDVIDHIEDGNIAKWMAHPAEARFAQPQLDLTIPVASLRCSGGRPMENDMTRALKSQQYPSIIFHFSSVQSGITHDIDRHEFQATISGQLSLAGVTREVSLTVAAQRVSRTRFRISAELPVHMSDFGITPPKALFGMIKASDKLSVYFDLTLEAEP